MASRKDEDEVTPSDRINDEQANSVEHENCSVSSVNLSADLSSKSYLRREALRQSQLVARGQQQHRRTSATSNSPGAYASTPLTGISPIATATTPSPRHAEVRPRCSLLQAKADIVAGATSESETEINGQLKARSADSNLQCAPSEKCKQEDSGAFQDNMSINHHSYSTSSEASRLPVALTVDIEETTQWLPSAIEYDVDSKPVVKRSIHARPLVCCVSLFLLSCTIAAVLAVIANHPDTNSYRLQRECIGIQEYVSSFLGESISLGGASQASYVKALDWIMHEDPQKLNLGSGGRLIQRFALAAVFYASQMDEGEMEKHSKHSIVPWLSAESECDWDGIVCDSLGQVKSIDLFDPESETTWVRNIPAVLWRLPFLQRLAIPFGKLENTDTPFEGGQNVARSLKHLSMLNLRGNKISATVNADIIGSSASVFLRALRSLKHVDLGQNKLEGSLNSTSLFSTPQDVKVVLLDDNMISGFLPIPANGDFHNLRQLNVAQNQLTGTIFRSFDELPHANEVMLNDNLFTGSVPELRLDSPLLHFEAGNNRFSGTIPKSLVASAELSHLGLAFNRLDGRLPPIIASQLRHFDVHGNRLSGSVEDHFHGDGLPDSVLYYDISLNGLNGSMASVCNGRWPSVIVSDCLEATECTCCTKCCHSITSECVDML